MPRRSADRDPFQRMWERAASIEGTLSALLQADPRAVRSILERTAEEYSNSRVSIPPQRLTGVALGRVKPDNCALSAANNLTQLSNEARSMGGLSKEDQRAIREAIDRIRPLVEQEPVLPLSWDAAEKLRLGRKTFMLNT